MKKNPLISISPWLIVVICMLCMGCEEESAPVIENNITIASVEIPGGTFVMGSPTSEANRGTDESQHTVTVSSFRMSIHEITNSEFASFLNAKEVDRYGKYPEGSSMVTEA